MFELEPFLNEVLARSQGKMINPEILPLLKEKKIHRIAPLDKANDGDLCFLVSRSYFKNLERAHPTLFVIREEFWKELQEPLQKRLKSTLFVICKNPYLLMAQLSEKFAFQSSQVWSPQITSPPEILEAPIQRKRFSWISPEAQDQTEEVFIHPLASVSSKAYLDRGVVVGPFCVIDEGVHIGAHSLIHPACTIGPFSKLGKYGVCFTQVSIYEQVEIGDRFRIHAGVRIGSDGFGYALNNQYQHQKIHHVGNVKIGNDVEIGTNTCIDRATFGSTTIGDGTKLDNLVHIAHNCELGKHVIICGCTAVAGSIKIGDYAVIGGVVGVGADVKERVQVAAMTTVSKVVPAGTKIAGNPQRELKEHLKVHAFLNQLLKKNKGIE